MVVSDTLAQCTRTVIEGAAMPSAPLIAVSPNYLPAEDRRLYKGKPLEYGEASLAASILAAGGMPIMVYRAEATGAALDGWADALIARVDGLVLSGGEDIAPGNYNEAAQNPAWAGNPQRDAFELALYRAAVAAGKPVLGICRGAQLIGVAEGGSLWQDLPSMRPDTLPHRSQDLYDQLGHGLDIDSPFLARLFDGESASVNSVHHQGLRDLPSALRVLAQAPDGVPESYVRDDAWVLGVQWHPEWMQSRASQRRLFETFTAAAAAPGDKPW